MWCVAELDNEYIEKMEDVLQVDEKPLSAQEPVVCVDEKSVTLHQDVRDPQSNAGSAPLGLHWWQPDIGWYFICALEAAGLASNVKRPRAR